MPSGVTVKFDLAPFQAKLDVLRRPQAPIMRALNKSIASGNTLAARLISQDTGLKVGTVKKALSIRKATASNLSATLSAGAKRIPLIEFGARGPEPSRGRPGGVRANLKGGAGIYPHAFIVTMKNGHRGVFERVKGGNRRGPKPNRSQLPIYELPGPSIWQVFQKVRADVQARVEEQFAKNAQSEIAYALSQAR